MTIAISPHRSTPRRAISTGSPARNERTERTRDSLRTIAEIRRAATGAPTRATRPDSGDLYAAHTLSRLGRVSPRAAQEFTRRLEADIRTNTRDGRAPRLAAATDRVMTSLVRDGFIGSDARAEIKRFALDRAPASAERPGSTEGNRAKPASSVADSITAATRHAANSSAANRVERGSSGGASTPKGPSIGIDAPSGFLWKPFSDSTGLLAILLPPSYTGDALAVDVLSPDGRDILENGRYTGNGNGGREHFRFNKPGGSYPPGSQVQVTRCDGTVERFTIPSPAIRNEGRVR